jgi:pyruvate dehydrogenase E2 component (dihydrolipoamide acetyltransferase)
MPQLGMGMFEGTIVRWIAADGAAVKRGAELLEIQTEKVVHTIEAASDGVLQRVAPEGAQIPVRGVIGYLLAPGEALARPGPEPTAVAAPLPERPAAGTAPAQPSREVRATPIARRLAAERGLDLADIAGSGPGGRIVEKDVLDAAAASPRVSRAGDAQPGPAAPEAPVDATSVEAQPPALELQGPAAGPRDSAWVVPVTEGETIPVAGIRAVIFERMARSSQTVARVTEFVEVDATALVELRARLNADLQRAGAPALSFNDLLIKVVATVLREHRRLNSTLVDGQIKMLSRINIGLAVDTERGLVVTVVPDADQKGVRDIARALREMVERAKTGKSLPEDFAGGTFTITNLGMYGIDGFTPIVNLPECAILGVGRIAPRPAVYRGALAVRQTALLSLSFDHRLVDGAPAARFLQRVAQVIEDPGLLLWA